MTMINSSIQDISRILPLVGRTFYEESKKNTEYESFLSKLIIVLLFSIISTIQALMSIT